jgi:ribosome-associated translation inhibitor RaiA
MAKIVFKNLEKSQLALQITEERFSSVYERFPELTSSNVHITLSMENSPTQAGADEFRVRFHCTSGKYKNVILEKSSTNLYTALAETVEHLLERLNRVGDKTRVKKIKSERDLLEQAIELRN